MREVTRESMIAFLVDTRGRSVEEASRTVDALLASRALSPVKGKPAVFTGNAQTKRIAEELRSRSAS